MTMLRFNAPEGCHASLRNAKDILLLVMSLALCHRAGASLDRGLLSYNSLQSPGCVGEPPKITKMTSDPILSPSPTTAPSSCPYRNLDFNTLSKGDWVTNQFEDWGVSIHVTSNPSRPGCTRYGIHTDANGVRAARAFDTANPGTCSNGCDEDLGSPNKGCATITGAVGNGPNQDEFPGDGHGGDPRFQTNSSYWNCEPQGIVLIIDEGWDTPDDAGCGGIIFFDFTNPAKIETLGIFDIDDDLPVYIYVTDSTGTVHTFETPGHFDNNGDYVADVGDNGIYHMPVNIDDAVQLKVHFESSGSIAYMKYHECP